MAKAPLKQRLRNGEVLIGGFVSAPKGVDAARIEEILKFHDYDFFHIDIQHRPTSEELIQSFCALAREYEVPVMLRIKHPRQAYMSGPYADLGVYGVEVPKVETEQTALEAIEGMYYPPIGQRSVGGRLALGFEPPPNWDPNENMRIAYTEWWNNSLLLALQVESLEAITITKRLAKPGIDLLSWGGTPAADMSISMAYNKEHPFQTDEECLRYTIEQLKGTDTKMMVRTPNPDARDYFIKMGAKVLIEDPPGNRPPPPAGKYIEFRDLNPRRRAAAT